MKPLYEIANNYLQVFDNSIDEDTGEIKDIALFQEVETQFNDKAIAVASFLKNLEANINAIKDAENAMKKRRQSLESLLESREEYLKSNMQRCDIKEISCPYFSIKERLNPESVNVVDESLVPDKFIVEKVVKSVDKNAVKAAIKNGEDVPGAKLIRTTKLEIK